MAPFVPMSLKKKERKGKERKGKERKGKERKGKERKGKEKNNNKENKKENISDLFLALQIGSSSASSIEGFSPSALIICACLSGRVI
jgi:hypothetical protein